MSIPWSGEKTTGPSFSGMEAMADGLLPEHELVKRLPSLLKSAGVKYEGRITAQRVRSAVIEDEKHHWKNSNGVRLIGFFNPERVVREIADLGEYF